MGLNPSRFTFVSPSELPSSDERGMLLSMANTRSSNGIFFSKPWSERPWWSKAKDVVSIALTGAVLMVVVWDAASRWLGH
jgi:hypothetical protein